MFKYLFSLLILTNACLQTGLSEENPPEEPVTPHTDQDFVPVCISDQEKPLVDEILFADQAVSDWKVAGARTRMFIAYDGEEIGCKYWYELGGVATSQGEKWGNVMKIPSLKQAGDPNIFMFNASHALGRALGVPISDDKASIMYPGYVAIWESYYLVDNIPHITEQDREWLK